LYVTIHLVGNYVKEYNIKKNDNKITPKMQYNVIG